VSTAASDSLTRSRSRTATPTGPGTTNDAATSRRLPTRPPPVRPKIPVHGSQRAASIKVTHSTQELPFPIEEQRPANTLQDRGSLPATAERRAAPALTHAHQRSPLLSPPAPVHNPSRTDESIDRIEKNLDKINDGTDDSEVDKAADDQNQAIKDYNKAILNGDTDPDTGRIDAAADKLKDVCAS
jgi:hypothetical protein